MSQAFSSFSFDDLFEVVVEGDDAGSVAPRDILSQYFDINEA